MYGGAAGGAKSWALLMDAARDVDQHATKALILRKTFLDLTQPGGLFDVANEWFQGTKASWDGKAYEWRFPSGAVIKFGYLDNETDHFRYQGGGYHIIAFDELTQIREIQYLYLFSRIRRVEDFAVKPRVRSATNPGGAGHEWVKDRFNLPDGLSFPESQVRKFLSSKLGDNPHLKTDEYLENMEVLRQAGGGSDVTYLQLAEGDWSVQSSGGTFDVDKFEMIEWGEVPPSHAFRNIIRFWDMGASAPTEANADPDFTAGVKIGVVYHPDFTTKKGFCDWYIFDVARTRQDPGGSNLFIESVARLDGLGIPQWFEQERGAAGKKEVFYWRNERLPDHMVRGLFATGTKESRAKTPANMTNVGRVFLVNGEWVNKFRAEAGAFPIGDHDDMVDAMCNGFLCLDREHLMLTNERVRAQALGTEGIMIPTTGVRQTEVVGGYKGY